MLLCVSIVTLSDDTRPLAAIGENFASFVWLKKNFIGLLWPNLICYSIFFIILRIAWLVERTILAPNLIHYNGLQCIQNALKCTVLCLLTVPFWCNLNALHCIVVNWWRVGAEVVWSTNNAPQTTIKKIA